MDHHGVHPPPEKVAVIQNLAQSSTVRRIRASLGLINFYRRFIPKCASTLLPLTGLLKDVKHNSAPLMWADTASCAFSSIKGDLADATLLTHPQEIAPINIMADSSDVAIGVVLQQCIHNAWQPLSFQNNSPQHRVDRAPLVASSSQSINPLSSSSIF